MDRGKFLKKAREEKLHPRHLRLLEHDFRNQNHVRPLGIVRDLKITPGKRALIFGIPLPDFLDEAPD